MFLQDDIYYAFTWVLTVYYVLVLTDVRKLEPESGNCDRVVLEVRTNADERSRYSNTRLNNHIHFRDHSYPGPGSRGNSQRYVDSSRSYPSAKLSLAFAHLGLHPHTASSGDSLMLVAIPSAKVINIGESAIIEESILVDARCVLPSQNFEQAGESL